MSNEDVEWHNVVELDEAAGCGEPMVRRIPSRVAHALENGSGVAGDCTLCEIRFVAEAGKRAALTLTSLNGGDLFIYRGDFLHSHIRMAAGVRHRQLVNFDAGAFGGVRADALRGGAFDPAVWRVVMDGPTLFHGIDRLGSRLRPPRPEEKPRRRWLAYGSSITHGFTPVSRMQCYAAVAARDLGVDVLNQGLAGSCWCEPAFADYLAGRDDWDFLTAELGVNMRGHFAPAEFERRVRYFVDTVAGQHPGKPLVLISPFPSGTDFVLTPDRASENTAAFRQILDTVAAEHAGSGVTLLDGRDILDDFTGLTVDLVHPSTEGHTLMGHNLARLLRPIVGPE
ncbi:MAG: hypothetical protein JJU00_16195 [Opitutales bacterium]|nr:hypothetical protein [Opitutales bacterium]